MFERVFAVRRLSLRNSFICLPTSFRYLKTGSCVKLIYGENKIAYFSVITLTAKLDDNSIGLNSLNAKALGIKENDLVTLSEIPQLPTVNSITISPLNNNDYEVLEMLAENVQSTLLDQIRVVNAGQKFVIWIGVNINVVVDIENVKPVSPGIIDFLTEVVIKPKCSNQNEQQLLAKRGDNRYSVFNMEKFKSFKKFLSYQTENGNSLHFAGLKDQLVYRLVPLKDLPFLEKLNKKCKLFNVFASRESFPGEWFTCNTLFTPVFCSLTLLTNDIFSGKIIYVRFYIFEDFIDSFNPGDLRLEESLFVDNILFEAFECHLGSRVVMKYIEETPSINEINIHAKKNYLLNVVEKFKTYLTDSSEDTFVLNPGIAINIGDNIRCSLTFSPVEAKFCVVNNELLKKYKYMVSEEVINHTEVPVNKSNCVQFMANVSNYEIIVNETMSHFCTLDNMFENILITGKPGTGKTTLLGTIKEKLESYPKFIYTKHISCKTIKGKTMDSLFKVFSTAYSELVLYQPSVLILDDLHVLCENVTGDENSPNALYANRISEMLHNLLKTFLDFNKIGICASAETTSKLNSGIYTARGSYLFKNLYSIDDFTKADRNELLKHFFGKHLVGNVSFDDWAIKTDGFVIQDIVDFYHKTIFEVYKDDRKELLKHFFGKHLVGNVSFDDWAIKTDGFVIQDIVDFYHKTIFEVYKDEEDDTADSIVPVDHKHLEKSLKNTCVLSLQNVQLHSPGNKNFSDLGGLDDVKKILVETLLWPAQYPSIFANAPLRLQSGLLLYGPPGTGKTVLAAAAAKHCGLRLISIKGPELLSKYIGASEQAVRDVFQKAQGARPCILFFDEFDSLAPRRGHDNTGVTDRVVNQLLTQLDGIESLSGVCVLAATSRPDLLDPALLRPGRLDRQILCPLPDKESRTKILKALSKNLDLSPDVDFDVISSSTEGYSGADLQSVLYTAQLSTVDHLLENSKDTANDVIPQISQKHLEDALSQTRPSLTSQERFKYEKIYSRFQGNVSEDFKPGSKATLA